MRAQRLPLQSALDTARFAPCRRQPLALGLGLALVFATSSAGAAEPQAATPALDRAWSDPRLLDIDAMDPLEGAALARSYGLEAFLPARTTTAVGNCNDNGAGSLRDAIATAASGDTLDLRGLPCSTITLSTGQIEVTQQNLTVIGAGPDALTIRNGNGTKYANRIFNHSGNGNLLVEGMTIADGVAAGSTSSNDAYGGCVRSTGTVILGNPLFVNELGYGVHVRNCRAIAVRGGGRDGNASGGGVDAAQIIMTNSVVSGNSISGPGFGNGAGACAALRLAVNRSEFTGNVNNLGTKYGGGGAVGGSLSGSYNVVLNSTVSGNSASRGGGLAFFGDAVVRNSTISGNTASVRGGGIYSAGIADNRLTLANSTVTGNVVTSGNTGGGLALYATAAAGAVLQSSIIAGNFRAGSFPDDITGTAPLTGANNLVGASGPGTQALPPGTLVGIDPRIGPLAYNGGPTRTHALRHDSPIIDLGNNAAGEFFDQRGSGFSRVRGQNADIGAFEFDPDLIFINGFDG